jgi:hypothetical protein
MRRTRAVLANIQAVSPEFKTISSIVVSAFIKVKEVLAFEMAKPSISAVTKYRSYGFRGMTKAPYLLHLGYDNSPLM